MRGVKTARQAARWLRSRWGQQLLILGYHRVADLAVDPFALAVRPAHFAEQMAVLRRAAHPVALADALAALKTGTLVRRAVAVTFDDGYADVYRQAYPVLVRHAIPATVFVVAGVLGGELWWDELARLILLTPVLPARLQLDLGGHTLVWARAAEDHTGAGEQAVRHALLSQLHRELTARSAAQATALAALRDWAAAPSLGNGPGETGVVVSRKELAALSADGLITIGSHTLTHAALPALPAAEQAAEICESKAALEQATGRAVNAFSYPHGLAAAETIDLVQAAGYGFACASHNDMAGIASNPFLLPRFWPGDIAGAAFEGWLRRWLHG
jgi:peptidoglycan/xylan/chitin deacetylase (PgdA/CDA1 family)